MNKVILLLIFSILTTTSMAQKKIKQTAGRDQLGTFAPKFAELNDDILFGEVWSRTEQLGLRDRSLVTITSLISQGITDSISNVTFEPRCRNNWHIHHATQGGGQMLIGIAGRGWYQEEGKAAVEILPGTVIHIPANVKHWHGAAANSWFAHLAFELSGENTSNEWLEPVTDEEYDKIQMLP